MIRMAEASARMSLREYVRADDIDLAISVAIESFVNAQKMSIKKTLQRVREHPRLPIIWVLTEYPFAFRRTTGLPQVSHAGARPRRAARLLAGSDR
jgi:hypothetical protein